MWLWCHLQAPKFFCTCLTLLAILPALKSAVLGLPLSAAAVNPGLGQGTNQTEIGALTMVVGTLFQSPAQEVAYGWLQGVDPCGTATCNSTTLPQCSWTGVSCVNWHITGIRLDPAIVTQPGIPSRLDGTLSPYLVYLSRLTSLQLANQGLTGTLPRVLGLLDRLQLLNLSNNVFTGFLPATWGLLSNLTTLNLGNNSLVGQVPASWTMMTSLSRLNLQNNSAICNPMPAIPGLADSATHNVTIPSLQFPACNASILAAQAAADGSPTPSPTAPTPPPAAPSPAAVASPVSAYRMSQGINVSVSVLVGICFLLGLLAGIVRIRQQRRRHVRMLAGLNQARRNGQYDPNYTPNPDDYNSFEPYPAADNPYCSTPRLVLGPDGHHLALARKLKQQTSEEESKAEASGQPASVSSSGVGSGPSDTRVPLSPALPQISLYTAVLDIDALRTPATAFPNAAAPMTVAPVDLVSPSTAPGSAATGAAAAPNHAAEAPARQMPAVLQVESSSNQVADGMGLSTGMALNRFSRGFHQQSQASQRASAGGGEDADTRAADQRGTESRQAQRELRQQGQLRSVFSWPSWRAGWA